MILFKIVFTHLNVSYRRRDTTSFKVFKKLHDEFFDSIRHYYDEENDRDLLITASLDSHVKVINFKREESEKIIDLNFQSKNRVIINTAYFINDIILVPFSSNNAGTIKFYNMNEEYISELEENVGFILGISVYLDEIKNNNYILIANLEGIISYNMELSTINKFIPKMTPEQKEDNCFGEPLVVKKGKKSLLLAPCFSYPFLFIWDFMNGDLIKKVETISGISDIFLWNNNYFFAGLANSDKTNFILVNIDKGEIEKEFKSEINNSCAGIKAIKHDSSYYLITANMKGNLDLYIM